MKRITVKIWNLTIMIVKILNLNCKIQRKEFENMDLVWMEINLHIIFFLNKLWYDRWELLLIWFEFLILLLLILKNSLFEIIFFLESALLIMRTKFDFFKPFLKFRVMILFGFNLGIDELNFSFLLRFEELDIIFELRYFCSILFFQSAFISHILCLLVIYLQVGETYIKNVKGEYKLEITLRVRLSYYSIISFSN